MYDENHLARALARGSEDARDAVFIHRDDGMTLTYRAFFDGAEALAAGLIDAGLVPGDRVTAQVDKTPEALQLYLATVLAGGVFQPLNTAYTGSELEFFLSDAEPAILVCRPCDAAAISGLRSARRIARIETLGSDGAGSLMSLERATDGFKPVARASDDLAAILYTSGTTGRSKGAMLTHGNLASNAQVLRDIWHFSSQDVLIHALPIFHTHGLFVATNVTMVAGASMRFHGSFEADAIVDQMPDSTVLMGVPTFYGRLLKHPNLAKSAPTMRLFVSGSAPLPEATHTEWSRITGHDILERYGMSETNMNASNPYEGERRPGSVGHPLPGTEIRIADPDSGAPLAMGEVGSIEVRGPNVFKGYWKLPGKTAEEIRSDGFFVTGDLGVFSNDGYLTIVGRSKDVVITGGYNVYPKEVEAAIDQLEGVQESAVFGVPHPDFGEGVVAAVVPAPGVDPGTLDIGLALAKRLARYKQPKRLVIVDQLPRNAMGKVEKNRLRERHADLFAPALQP